MSLSNFYDFVYSATNGNKEVNGDFSNEGGGSWTEFNDQGVFQYTEIDHNSQGVTLYDASRSLTATIQGQDVDLSFPGASNYQYGSVLQESKTRTDGATVTSLYAPGQYVYPGDSGKDVVNANHQGETDFVFKPGFGEATITGFTAAGDNHDTLELSASDFANIADVLRHTKGTAGGAVITDPSTGETIKLVGVSKATLSQHRSDFALT